MAYEAVREPAAEHYLRTLDALATEAGLGAISAVLLEFDTAPVAMARGADGGGYLIKGPSPASAARILLEARKLRTTHAGADAGAAQAAEHGDDLEVAQARLEPSGQVITATVELVHGGRRVVARSTGRNAAERHLFLMAEAAARAVTEFLPPGYGVILGEIKPASGALGDALQAAVLFMTPTEDRPLEGVAPVADHPDTAAARTVLAAVCDHVRPLLGSTAGEVPAVDSRSETSGGGALVSREPD